MANERTGQYGGTYYGSYFNESEPLTDAEMQVNARYLYEVLHYIHGWTMNAVAAILVTLLDIATSVKLVQLLNACSPMLTTPQGITTLDKSVQFWNA